MTDDSGFREFPAPATVCFSFQRSTIYCQGRPLLQQLLLDGTEFANKGYLVLTNLLHVVSGGVR